MVPHSNGKKGCRVTSVLPTLPRSTPWSQSILTLSFHAFTWYVYISKCIYVSFPPVFFFYTDGIKNTYKFAPLLFSLTDFLFPFFFFFLNVLKDVHQSISTGCLWRMGLRKLTCLPSSPPFPSPPPTHLPTYHLSNLSVLLYHLNLFTRRREFL